MVELGRESACIARNGRRRDEYLHIIALGYLINGVSNLTIQLC